MKLRSLVAVALVLTGSSVGSAAAQSSQGQGVGLSSVRGLSLGVSAAASGIDADGFHTAAHNGGGLSVALGYGISDAMSLFVRGTTSYQHAHYDAGARYSLGGSRSRLRPYVEGAFTYTRGIEHAAGLRHEVSPRIATDRRLRPLLRMAGEGGRPLVQLV